MEGLSGSRFSCLCSLLIETIHNHASHVITHLVSGGSRLLRRCWQSQRKREHRASRDQQRGRTRTEGDRCPSLRAARALPRCVKLFILHFLQLLLLQVGRVGGAHLPTFPRTFNGSENDLTLAYNSSLTRPLPGGRVRYNPDGRTSPEVSLKIMDFKIRPDLSVLQVQMYKTRVIYHSRQDCADDHQPV